ncbi:MAG: porin family protein [Chlorobium sp.]|jgi:opacity protein-like surface antigen|nr:porin family protein [Chlorobium sp.]
MKKKLTIIAGSWIFLAASAVHAAPNAPYYFGAGIGLSSLRDATLSESGVPFSIDAEFSAGFGLSAALGYDFDFARMDLELGYKKNDINNFSAFGISVPASGDVTSKSVMMNFYHDFTTSDSRWSPFLGAGLGVTRLNVDNATIIGFPLGEASDTVFAWQLMAGIGYKVANNTIIDLSYRYFATTAPDFDGMKAEYNSHNVMVGLRFLF